MKRMIKWLAALGVVSALAACGSDDDPQRNLVEKLQGDARFTILVEAVVAAGLADTLDGPDQFTVFAPTNDAFAALLAELGVTKDELLNDKPLLTAVLQYHVLSGVVRSTDVQLGKAITPLAGGIFKIDAPAGVLTATDGRNRTARVTQTDIEASNGVIHVLDRVILPANLDIVETALGNPDFSLLVEAVVAADLADTLKGPGPFTVFAPTNAAFAALLAELGVSKDDLFADKALLTKVLTYHVLAGRVLKADVPVGSPIPTVQGDTFTVDSSLMITDKNARMAAIVATDVFATNGVIHVIDKVILPTL